jgi:hypothetical protein
MSLIPLSTAVLGDAPREPLAVAFYGAVLTANAASFTSSSLRRLLGDRDGKLDDIHRAIKKDGLFTACPRGVCPARLRLHLHLDRDLRINSAYFFRNSCPGRLGKPGAGGAAILAVVSR